WTGELSLGKERRYVAVVRDITERNRAEQELERTRKQYYHQEKMAAIGQLAAGILHEVGNPIAAIAGAAQDMRSAKEGEVKNNKDDSLVKVVDRNLMLIEEHTERLAKITRDIAEFASPRIDKRVLTDINGLIRSTARLLGYDRRFRNIKLHQMLDSQLPAVQAVPDQITQVLMNLVINALDAAVSSKQSVPIVEIISNLVDGGVEIEVRDNGTGMDEQILEHAFEPFFTTKEPGKGTGLGLSLCNSIISSHNGTLQINSQPNKGTSVHVFLPGLMGNTSIDEVMNK
ncbi:MAG: ATP-binding protein, partial [Candidatus Thiodiazotropha sp. (ex Lucinoma borealis)]|nr:ATP-binding protein [Candidatus Thiodiazotropha sp. (ex Lucinoma borealis)]